MSGMFSGKAAKKALKYPRSKGSEPYTGIKAPGQDAGPDDDGIPGTPNRQDIRRRRRGGIGPARTPLSP